MCRFLCRVILAASLFVNLWAAGNAATETGTAVAVVQTATATGGNDKRTLEAGMAVFVGERITTGRTGRVQLIFTDDTKMVVGPNSSLLIEAYLLRSGNTVSNFAVKALGGSFRFITGKSQKSAYSIATPTGTIGVRGTSFDAAIRNTLSYVLSLEGVPEVCSNGVCLPAPDACSLASAPRIGEPSLVSVVDERNRIILEFFPWIVSQEALLLSHQVSVESCGNITKSNVEQGPGQEPFEEVSAPSTPAGPGVLGAVGALGAVGLVGAIVVGTGNVAVTP